MDKTLISPLPPNPYTHAENKWREAYDQCLQIHPPGFDISDKNSVYARILGYLILEAPTPEGRNYVSQEILNRKGDIVKLHEFAEFFMWDVLSLFEDRFSGPEEEKGIDQVLNWFRPPIDENPGDYDSAKKAALYRDHYRCMITHSYDLDHYCFVMPYEERNQLERSTFFGVTFACNVVPPLPNTQDPQALSPAWDFFCNYTSIPADELSSIAFSLTNIMTLAHGVVGLFNRFYIWLEHVPDTKSTYKICPWNNMFDLPYYTELTTKTNLPLPSPRYIKVHAAFRRVARLSGAASCLEKLESDKLLRVGEDDEEEITYDEDEGEVEGVDGEIVYGRNIFDEDESDDEEDREGDDVDVKVLRSGKRIRNKLGG